ncbi:MAG: PilZ domain-containing protein [Dongiaceae bacterium]
MRVLAFASQKSGAGKTTLAGHMAIQALQAGVASVALIDADPDASLADWCALRDGQTPRLTRATPDELPAEIEKLRQEGVDIVIIDMPPAMSHSSNDTLAVADLVAIPTRPCAHDLEAAGATVALAQTCGKPFVFVVNGAMPDGELTPEVVMALAQHGTVASVAIPRNLAFVESMIDGRTVMEMNLEPSPAPEIVRLWEYLLSKFPKDGGAAAKRLARSAEPAATVLPPAPPKAAQLFNDLPVATVAPSPEPAASPPPVTMAAAKPTAVPGPVASLSPEQMRRYPRFNYERPATLTVAGKEVDCIVHDISAGGALIRISTPLSVGATVILTMPIVGRLAAEVRHRDGDRAGLRFTIDPRSQLNLVKQLSTVVAAGTAQ